MKKIFQILIFIICYTVQAQKEFSFDLYCDYLIVQSKDQKAGKKEVSAINSKNSFEELRITIDKRGKSYAYLHDKKTKKSHYFKVAKKETSALTTEDFKYNHSVQWPNSECFTPLETFKVVEKDSASARNVKIDSFVDTEQKPGSVLQLNTNVSDFKIYNCFKNAYLHHYDNCERLQINENYLVNRAQFIYENKVWHEVKLLKSGVIDLKITIREFNYITVNEHFGYKEYFID